MKRIYFKPKLEFFSMRETNYLCTGSTINHGNQESGEFPLTDNSAKEFTPFADDIWDDEQDYQTEINYY